MPSGTSSSFSWPRRICKLLRATIEAIVVERPEVTGEAPQHLCLDKGYDNPTGREAAVSGGHTPHIRRIGEDKKPCDLAAGHKPRRWVVERTFAWLCKCRAILVRYDRHDSNDLGLMQLVCDLLVQEAIKTGRGTGFGIVS